MKYAGFYINLDRSPERKKAIEAELARNGLGGRYTRFAATDGNALNFPNPHRLVKSEIGCFTSHYRLLMANKDQSRPMHVIEDDIVLCPPVEMMLDRLIESGEINKYDLVFTDVHIPLMNQYCNIFKDRYDANVKRDNLGKFESTAFSIIDMGDIDFASTCSFLVNGQSIGKLATLYEAELKKGAETAIDVFINKLSHNGDIKVGCLFPFITSIRPESCDQSTIHNRRAVSTFADHMLRHSFFIGCNFEQSLKETTRTLPQLKSSDLQGQIHRRLMEYSLTTEYRKSDN